MAYDKVVDSTVLNNGLKSIADAIREKAGLEDNFAFPTGFAEAIAGIKSGEKVAFGTITPASNVSTLTITHGLGETPSFVMIMLENGYSVTTHSVVMRLLAGSKWGDIGTKTNASNWASERSYNHIEVTATDATFNKIYYNGNAKNFNSGVPYIWVCATGVDL